MFNHSHRRARYQKNWDVEICSQDVKWFLPPLVLPVDIVLLFSKGFLWCRLKTNRESSVLTQSRDEDGSYFIFCKETVDSTLLTRILTLSLVSTFYLK